MRIIISLLMVCLSLAACNVRESLVTGGRYAMDSTQLIAKGKTLADAYGNCVPQQVLKDMNEEEFRAWQAYLKLVSARAGR
ncbi:hypothetical protein GFS24_20560 [Chitinophaga sp. SYP-B3965]|uniref:hypothetical protein n=1 Tax=Chitinophaga sp. SYP-B3965 TaxID=2663120 RepID=UPI001299B9D8|nr:hypothetical protein [Chitinophaga sp. SYP-B3965]MRG47526.1 hypothetical protein [Chitinophaga sp. SYP-B3965]